MSIKAMTWAFSLPLEPRAKIALLAIADNARDDGIAWPSRDLIAEKSSQSRATIKRRLKILSDIGVLAIHERYREDGSQTTDEIRLDLSLTTEEVMRRLQRLGASERGESAAENDDDATADESHEASGGGAQAEPPPDHCSTPGGAVVTRGGVHCGTPQYEPSLEPSTPPKAPSGGPLSKADKELKEKRSALWRRLTAAYEGISAMDQSLARQEFDRLPIDDAEWAVSAAVPYGAECRKLRKPPKNAHIWIRKGIFRNFPREGGGPQRKDAWPRDSLEARALINLHAICGKSEGFRQIFVRDVVTYRKDMTDRIRAFAELPAPDKHAILNHQQAGAWTNFCRDVCALPGARIFSEGDRAPWLWPPKTDGTVYAPDTTGPPPLGELSDQDAADFTA